MLALVLAAALTGTPAPSPALAVTPAPSPAPAASNPAAATTPTPGPASIQLFMATPQPSSSAVLPPCPLAEIAPATVLDSKTAEPGQPFKFTVSNIDDPGHAFASLAAGAEGWGVIAVVRHGRTGGDPGLLVLEARFVIAPDGRHVPVEFVRSRSGLFMGKSHNSPGVLGWIPYVSYVSSAYDAFHKGGDVAAGPNNVMSIALGDDAVMGACALPTAAP